MKHKHNFKYGDVPGLGELLMIKQEITYCQECAGNYGDDAFDYRFDYPVCHKCVEMYKLTPERESYERGYF